MVLTPWDRRMAYGEHVREEMKSREAQLRNFFCNIDVAMRQVGGITATGPQKWAAEETTLMAALTAASEGVRARLLDSIDTRGAMDALSDLIKAVNVYLSSRQDASGPPPQAFLLRQAAAFVTKTLSVFGLAPSAGDTLGMNAEGGEASSASDGKTAAVLDAFCSFRDSMRSAARSGAPPKEFLTICDEVRDGVMVDLGIRLEDKSDGGSVWKTEDPAVLRAEREEKAAAVAAAAAKKLKSKLDLLKRDVDKFEKLAALPSPQEALKEKYSKFDKSTGEPTHDAQGTLLEGKALDKAKKELEKQKKVRGPLEKRIADEGADFLSGLRAEVEALEAQLAGMSVGGRANGRAAAATAVC